MKILLLGDFSGFFSNLKDGLIGLGYEVDLATTGDNFKKTSKSDLYMPNSKSVIKRKLDKVIFPLTGIKNYYGYDIVQAINHDVFGGLKYNYNYFLMKRIKNNSGKMFMSACGTDYFVYQTGKNLEYNPIDATIELELNGYNPYTQKEYYNNNINVLALVDGIIPTTYTYAESYRNHPKLLNTIPFPMNVDNIKFIPQKIENNRLKIFHGLNREGFKGTKYIKEAMNKIKERYPNDVEITIDGNMSLEKYLEVLKNTNIVVDQALSYEYGMNALYSMAMGKVVLSGNEPECQQELGRADIPIINIKPSVDDIYNKLETLVLDKKRVEEIGYKSREFIEDFHHHVKVAQKYADIWGINQLRGGN